MKAILTKRNDKGIYPDVGGSDRTVLSHYKTLQSLLRYGIPLKWDYVKIELFHDNEFYSEPYKTVYFERGN